MSNDLKEELQDYVVNLRDKIITRVELTLKSIEHSGEGNPLATILQLQTDEMYDILKDLETIVERYDDEDEEYEDEDSEYDSSYPDKRIDGYVFCGKCGKIKL